MQIANLLFPSRKREVPVTFYAVLKRIYLYVEQNMKLNTVLYTFKRFEEKIVSLAQRRMIVHIPIRRFTAISSQ